MACAGYAHWLARTRGRWERETQLVGFTEGEVAAELASRWNFPPEICLTSSDPLTHKPFPRLGGIVHIAMLLAEIAVETDKNASDTIDALPADVLKALQLDHDYLKEHLPDVTTFTDAAA